MSEELMTEIYLRRLKKAEYECDRLRGLLRVFMRVSEDYAKAVAHMNDGCDCCAMRTATDVPEYADLQGWLCDLHHDLRGPE
jgi:hypothetical protein